MSLYQSFSNTLLTVLKVPPEPLAPAGDHRHLRIFRASYNYYRYRLLLFKIKAVISVVFGIAITIGIYFAYNQLSENMESGPSSIFLLLPFGFMALLIIIITILDLVIRFLTLRLDYENRWYKLTDKSLRVREGVFTVHEMTLTFNNIQHISIEQGPLQRIFKITDVKVDSAGGGASNENSNASSMHSVYFTGVDNGEEIREILFSHLKKLRTSGLGDLDDKSYQSQEENGDTKTGVSLRDLLSDIRRETHLFRKAAEK